MSVRTQKHSYLVLYHTPPQLKLRRNLFQLLIKSIIKTKTNKQLTINNGERDN